MFTPRDSDSENANHPDSATDVKVLLLQAKTTVNAVKTSLSHEAFNTAKMFINGAVVDLENLEAAALRLIDESKHAAPPIDPEKEEVVARLAVQKGWRSAEDNVLLEEMRATWDRASKPADPTDPALEAMSIIDKIEDQLTRMQRLARVRRDDEAVKQLEDALTEMRDLGETVDRLIEVGEGTEAAQDHTIDITNAIDPDKLAEAMERGMKAFGVTLNEIAERLNRDITQLRVRNESWDSKIYEERNDASEKPDTISAKRQLIHLIERTVPDDAPMCSATFSFRGHWDGLDYGPFALAGTIAQVEVEHDNRELFDNMPRINITTNDLFGRPS